MSVLGWFLSFAGFVGLIVGLLQMLKGKKMNAVPFRAPTEIAQLGPGAADAKGLVSTEGTVHPHGLLTAPMSGKPCLAFEITIERKWEKTERTENGTSTTKGSSNVFSDYKGGTFALQDAQGGTVLVDAAEKPDASFEKAHNSGVNGIPSVLHFGGFQMSTPLIMDTSNRTIGFEGTEKIITPSGNLYALGALAMGPQGPVMHTPKGIGAGKLILSCKGRAHLVKATKRNMILGYALGGVMFVGGTALGIFGPAPDLSTASGGSACSSLLTSDALGCDGRMYERDGLDMKWTVPTAGEYTLTVSQPKVKYPIDPALTIKDASGKEVGHDIGISKGAEAKVAQKFEAGTYTINVKDTFNDKVKGGYGFHLDIVRAPDAPAAVASANVTSAELPPVAKAAGAAVKGKTAPSGKAAASGSAPAAPKASAPAAPAKSAAPKK